MYLWTAAGVVFFLGGIDEPFSPLIGITRIGSAEGQHIRIQGREIQGNHCYIDNDETVITLCPLNKALVSVDGHPVTRSIALTQGKNNCFCTIG